MDSHNLNFLPGNSAFSLSSCLDANYLAKHIINNRGSSEDSTIQFHKMDIKHEIDQPCQFISGTSLVNHLEGYSKKNSYQIKNYKQIDLSSHDHVNVMPISSSFLIGGYVGSKSQKENAHRTRINVQIHDFILNKLVDLMGNAVQNARKYSKDLTKAEDYMFNVTSSNERKNTGMIRISKSIKELIVEHHHPSQISQSRMCSQGKQSYADVTKTISDATKTTKHNPVPELPLPKKLAKVKLETELPKIKMVKQCKTSQFVDYKTKSTTRMTKRNSKRDYKPIPKVDIRLSHPEQSCNGLDTLNYRKSQQRVQEDKVKNKSKMCELTRLGIDILKHKKSNKSTEEYNEKTSNCLVGLTEVVKDISRPIPVLRTCVDLVSDTNNSKQKIDSLDQINLEGAVVINFHPSEKSPIESMASDGIYFGLSPKNNCDVDLGNIMYNNSSVSASSKQEQEQLNQNRIRAISECSIDSEDSFIVFAYDCDRSNGNHGEESDDIVWSDESCFSDDGYCDKVQ